MPPANQKFAASLDLLARLQRDGSRVFRLRQFHRVGRKRRRRGGFRHDVRFRRARTTSPPFAFLAP